MRNFFKIFPELANMDVGNRKYPSIYLLIVI